MVEQKRAKENKAVWAVAIGLFLAWIWHMALTAHERINLIEQQHPVVIVSSYDLFIFPFAIWITVQIVMVVVSLKAGTAVNKWLLNLAPLVVVAAVYGINPTAFTDRMLIDQHKAYTACAFQPTHGDDSWFTDTILTVDVATCSSLQAYYDDYHYPEGGLRDPLGDWQIDAFVRDLARHGNPITVNRFNLKLPEPNWDELPQP